MLMRLQTATTSVLQKNVDCSKLAHFEVGGDLIDTSILNLSDMLNLLCKGGYAHTYIQYMTSVYDYNPQEGPLKSVVVICEAV